MIENIEAILWLSILIAVVGIIVGLSFWGLHKIAIPCLVLGFVSLLITLLILPTYIPMMEKKQELLRQDIDARNEQLLTMSCEEMRLDIIDIMENDKKWYIENKLEWEKDYYHHKCEIPLREEVLKLQ